MGKKKYTEISAIARVRRGGGDISNKIDKITGQVIKCVSCRNVGNGTWGAFDYLVNCCGYIQRG